jgi:hypothetical protein
MLMRSIYFFGFLGNRKAIPGQSSGRMDGIAVKLKGEVHGLKSKAHDSPDPATDGHDPSTFVGLFPIGRGVTRSRRSRNPPSILVRSMNVTIEQLSVRTSYSLDAW